MTGRSEASLARGLPACFEEVLVKVSGDPRLIGDPRVAALLPEAPTAVREVHFRDRLEGMPTHDEQGTRDRPHDMTVRFESTVVDAMLRSLGREPWREPRPRMVVLLSVDNGARRYVLSADGELGRDQRDALAAAGWRFGIPVQLPRAAMLTGETGDPQGAETVRKAVGGDLVLLGRLIWHADELGWQAEWSFPAHRERHQWQIRGVSFDAAFRHGLAGAAQILSGNGAPD